MKPRLVTADASPASLRTLSPARQKLSELLDQVAHHERRITEHRAAADRLEGIIVSHRDARAALEAFDAESAAAAAEWAKASLKSTPPAIDGKRRGELLADVATAQESASAAATARKQFIDLINAELQAITSLKLSIGHAVAEVIAETAAGPMLDDLRQAVAIAVQKQVRVKAAFDALITIAHSGGDFETMRPVFLLSEELSANSHRRRCPTHTGFRAGSLGLAEVRCRPSRRCFRPIRRINADAKRQNATAGQFVRVRHRSDQRRDYHIEPDHWHRFGAALGRAWLIGVRQYEWERDRHGGIYDGDHRDIDGERRSRGRKRRHIIVPASADDDGERQDLQLRLRQHDRRSRF